MRSFRFEHAGVEYQLAATFDAAAEIAETVADPLMIAREAHVSAAMAQNGLVHYPRFSFTIDNVPRVLAAGLRAAGNAKDIGAVRQIVFEMGFIEAQALADRYLAMLVTPQSERPTPDTKGDVSPEK